MIGKNQESKSTLLISQISKVSFKLLELDVLYSGVVEVDDLR